MCYSVCICCFLVNFLFSHTNSSAIPLPYNSIHIVFPFLSFQDQTFLWKIFAEHSIHFTSLHFLSLFSVLFCFLIDRPASSFLLFFFFRIELLSFFFLTRKRPCRNTFTVAKMRGKIDDWQWLIDWFSCISSFLLTHHPLLSYFATLVPYVLPSFWLYNYPSPPPLPPFNSYSMFIQKSPTFKGFLLIFNSNSWWLSAVTFLYFSTSFLTLLLYFSLAWLTLLFLLLLFLLHSLSAFLFS